MGKKSPTFKPRYVIITVVLVLTVGFGIYMGNRAQESRKGNTNAVENVVVNATQVGLWKTKQNAPAVFRPQNRFSTREKIALQVDWSSREKRDLSMAVRLRDENGSVQSMDPPNVLLSAGEKNFCCWQIDEPGNYTFQIFKPNGTMFLLPVEVYRDARDSRSEG